MYQPRRRVRIVAATLAAIALPATALVLSGATQATAGGGAATGVAASAAKAGAQDSAGAKAGAQGSAKAGGQSSDVVGLTDRGRLVKFRSADRIRSAARVLGLKDDRRLVGIDFRVQDGKLYGVGDRGGIYTINTGAYFGRASKVSQLSVALDGQNFGVDFNPAANRLRVISDTGQNLRHNIDDPAGAPASGMTAVDGTLAYPGVPPAPAPTATGVTAAAYTNNDLDPNTATTLFDIDTMLDQVVIQSPANAGLLAPTGKLTVDVGPWAGFDISTQNGSNRGLAVLSTGDRMRLYDIELTTGKATRLGSFPRDFQVVDLAVPLGR
ncbi:DUF4394 domain-containing protein [Kribbella pittospori]|uniref:DUF4394 domain-containing protein n=1 Tax=Kribbella pittospori TaxID=722689 RepID=A0A4R0KU87_9ACTN|nr:DUF4394 domain-containing protein [Kribbella pittospori]TCC64521.1 DUF4394 domain-containing protein [Kribbella pittospori]